MAYFSQYRGGGGSVLPPGYMEAATAPGRNIAKGILAGVDGIMTGWEKGKEKNKIYKHSLGLADGLVDAEIAERKREGGDKNLAMVEQLKGFKAELPTKSMGEITRILGQYAGKQQAQDHQASLKHKESMSRSMDHRVKQESDGSSVHYYDIDQDGKSDYGQIGSNTPFRLDKDQNEIVYRKLPDGSVQGFMNGKQVGEPMKQKEMSRTDKALFDKIQKALGQLEGIDDDMFANTKGDGRELEGEFLKEKKAFKFGEKRVGDLRKQLQEELAELEQRYPPLEIPALQRKGGDPPPAQNLINTRPGDPDPDPLGVL